MVVDIVVKEKTNQQVITTENSSMGQAQITNKKRAGFMNTFAGPIRSNDSAGELHDNINTQKQQQYATNYIEKKTRIFAEAIKMNLKLEEALPILEKKIAKQIVGIF
ncbi:TraT complement resistance protein [Hydrogenimonas thermophila]|uniref:TraT complement resistance protein n=2 Tax=Hydrogenimonas thermophila TaxID=223786 RepID=A0A1I5P8C4_9BACT|nr:TraT complement resistance protein [Hydrogenimonas thermophila]